MLARATALTGVAQLFSQLVRFGANLLLARLLTPSDFGMIAVAMVLTVFMDQLRDLGTGAALVQRPVATPALTNTVFSINTGLGLALAGGLALAADPIAHLLQGPEAAGILRVYALITLIAALGQVHYALLRRQLRFGPLAAILTLETVVTVIVSVTLAYRDHGAWSIAWGTLAGTAAATATVWVVSRWVPTGVGSLTELRDVWRFSINLFLANLVWFVAVGQLDKALISRTLGLAPLGTYSLAQRTVTYPLLGHRRRRTGALSRALPNPA